MGVIDLSSYKPVPGTSGDANQLANGFTALETVLNGNLDRQNIANGIIGARTSTTVAGLGTLYNGDVVYIRAGASPYDFVKLVYDSTYGHAVSDQWVYEMTNVSEPTTTSAAYVDFGTTSQSNPAFFLPYKTIATAGLTLQLRVLAICDVSSGAQTSTLAAAAKGADAAGSVATDLTNVSAAVTNTGTTSQVMRDSGWQDVNSSITSKDFIRFSFAIKVTGAATATLRMGSTILGRWRT